MATYTAAIQKLYVAYFNRPADPDGLAFWEGVVTNAGGDTTAVAAAFAATAEYDAEYGGKTNTAVVTQVYQNLFGRAPDAAGLAFWVNALDNDLMTIDLAVTTIAAGAVNADGTPNADGDIFANKVTAASAFTAAVDTPAEKAGYAGEDALAAAKAFISGIETDAQLEAAIAPAALAASVAAVVAAGTPFTLVAGLQALEAATTAKADFLEEVELSEADIATDLTDAGTAVDAEVEKSDDYVLGDYTAASTAVKAAILTDYQAELAADFAAAQKVQAAEQVKVTAITGLTEAIAAAKAAAAAVPVAAQKAALAGNAMNAELADFATLAGGTVVSATLFVDADLSNDVVTIDLASDSPDAGAITVIEYDAATKSFVLSDDIEEADFEGVTALLQTINANLTAKNASAAAVAAAYDADLELDILDLSAAAKLHYAAVAAAFVASEPEDEDAPTVAEMRTEMTILTTLVSSLEDAVGGINLAAADGGDAELAALLATAQADGAITAADVTAITTAFDTDPATAEAAVTANNNLIDFKAAVDAFIDLDNDIIPATSSETNTVVDNFNTAVTGVEAVEAQIEALNDALADLADASANVSALAALNAAITAANKSFTDNDFAAPKMIDTANEFASGGDDVFVVSADSTVSNIQNFGLLGDDVIFLGSDVVLNTGKIATAGNNSVLEVFLTEVAGNATITLETEPFGSNSTDAEIVITLVGVSLDEINFANGFITLG